jgi:metallo-beta-lactamase class B
MLRRLFLLLIAVPLLAQTSERDRAWNQPVTPVRIVGNVYYVGAAEVTSFLITTPGGHILLDGGFAETAPQIEQNIERLGFRLHDVKILLSSHAHYDHAGGLAELKRATGARLYAGAGDVGQLARGGRDDPQFGDSYPFPPVIADRALRDGERITLGGVTIVAHATPGHTRGCTTYSLRTAGHDVVFVGSPTAPEPYRVVGNPAYPDALADYRHQFAVLESLKCDVFLGAHGSFFHLSEKLKTHQFIDPKEYRLFVTKMNEAFEARVSAGALGGVPKHPAGTTKESG